MVYSNKTEFGQVGFLSKVKVKFGKRIAKSFPYNKIRVWGLKMCGYSIGEKVFIGEDLIVASIISEKSCQLTIGDRVAIGPRVTLLLSSDANWSKLMEKIDHIKSFVILEDDCWLGAGVIIMPGVTVGAGSIVGSGAVVTKDVPPNTVVAGVPARIIKRL
jgi:acetyltransferase-like isoleucine patch superfamily enzyme